jgi:hypothetical protein
MSNNNSLRMKYIMYKKKICGYPDLQLFDKDFDMSDYTLVMDERCNTNIIRKKFKKVIINCTNFNINLWVPRVYEIFSSIVAYNFATESLDIIWHPLIGDANAIIRIFKNYNIRKFHAGALSLPNIGALGILKIPSLRIRLSDHDAMHLEKNITDIYVTNLNPLTNLNIHSQMTSLTRVHIQHNFYNKGSWLRPAFNQFEKLFANNKITDVTIDIGVVCDYPDIMNLLHNIKVFRLYSPGVSDVKLLGHIFNYLSDLKLDKIVIQGINGADNVSTYLKYLANIDVTKIKIYGVATMIDMNQFFHMISNPNLKHVFLRGRFNNVNANFTRYYNLDHLKELHIGTTQNNIYEHIENYLEQTLTSNSEIVRIDFIGSSLRSLYISDLMNKNLDYDLNKLYRVTKAIIQTPMYIEN